MSTSLYATPAQLRGCVVGMATGALAIAAHGMAGGGYPASDGFALLLLAALVTGTISGSFDARPRRRCRRSAGLGIFLPLTVGQFVGHWALSGRTGHHTEADAVLGDAGDSPLLMLTAHLLAVLLCTLTITVAERLYREASAALRTLLTPPRPLPRTPRVLAAAIVAILRHCAPNGAAGPRAPPARVDTDVPVPFAQKAADSCSTDPPRSCVPA